MRISRQSGRLLCSVCLLGLAACSSGGGAAPVTSGGNNTPPSNNMPAVSISAPATLGTAGLSGPGSNFTTSPPPVGTTIPLAGGTVVVSPNTIADANVTQITATYRGTVTTNGVVYPVFDLSIPALSITASNVRGDGTSTAVSGGGQIAATYSTLTYSLAGIWAYTPASGGKGYLGVATTGYLTPAANIPTTGSATYTGNASSSGPNGGVAGYYAVPNGSGSVQQGVLSGNVSLNVNFTTNAAAGSFTNMTATPINSDATSGTATPWNDVSISGNLSRTGATAGVISGRTSTSGAPSGAGVAGFSSAASGQISGTLNGPQGQEVAGTWTLSESTAAGGKAAFGAFGAKQ